ncbi:MAG: hypothetical protein JST16_03405 [Bdellovibrionales bacterium]|nr:hypothetical protein [Bdellovibrionales bacterium]
MKKDYQSSGVDTRAADVWVEGVAKHLGAAGPAELRARLKSGVGDYAAIYESSPEQWIALSCDGVGTKILWAEEGLGSARGIAQDLVAMNANDLLCVGARPALFLDYLAVGSLELAKSGGPLADFMPGLAAAASESGMIVVGGETAQMPDIYGAKGYDLAGFALGFMRPEERLSIERVQPGSELWGWPSEGPHSNGFSWLRKLFSADGDRDFIARELMRPTPLYARRLQNLREQLKQMGASDALQAAFHITGSGVLNLIRAQPAGRTIGFDIQPWHARSRPTWLNEVQARARATDEQLWTTFNMGIGFCVVLAPDLVHRAKSLLESQGLERLGGAISQPLVLLGDSNLS